ncbi:MAG: ABC transporter substrate-binding protein, partial [Pseudolabrys sp.]
MASAWIRLRTALSVAATAIVLAACTTQLGGGAPTLQPGEETIANASVGEGQVRVGLVLPLSAQGNAGVAAQSMKNAAEMALAEFKSPNIQLLVKDDGGTPQGAQNGAQQAISEGAEIIIGPLFAQSVS